MSPMCGYIDVINHPTSVIDKDSHYVENLRSTVLQKASVQFEGHMPLPCDILFEYDLPIELRDGVTVYADVYRPPLAKDGTVPAIIVAGPFGKNGGPNRHHFDRFPWRMGCPRRAVSGLEKFEGPDPAYWCFHGYAIVHTGMESLTENNPLLCRALI
jgi:predicted acyl esterase